MQKQFKTFQRIVIPLNFARNFLLGLLLVISCVFSQKLYAQDLQVTGQVTDQAMEPLPGVSVVIRGTTVGTVTDVDGRFSLTVPTGSTLVFSYVGMQTRQVPITDQTELSVVLTEELTALDEIVVIGYAEQSRMRTTASVSRVGEEELRNIPSVSPVQALQGKMAGVSIPVLTGQPGTGANIVIRGGTTLRPYGFTPGGRDVGSRDPSDPLVIVDGVFRDFNDVNPDDIASIQIMKDAASTAIYGARGANGVILITTKSGRGAGEPTFTFRYQHGMDTQHRKYDDLNAREYIQLARPVMARGIDAYDPTRALYFTLGSATVTPFSQPGQYGNFKFTTAYLDNLIEVEGQEYVNNLLAQGWETMDDPVNPGNTIIFKDSKYQDVVWQTANTQNYNFGVDGSTESVHYNLSAGFIDQGGTFLGTGYKRFSALANTGYKVNEKLDFTLNLSYLWNDDKYSDNTVRDFTRGVRVPPLNRLYHDDGTPHIGEGNNPRNRPHQLYYQDFNANTTQFIIRLAADYEIVSGLRYRPSVSLYTTGFNQMNFEKYYPQQPQPRQKYQRIDDRRQLMTDHVFQYSKTAGDHNFMVLGGFNYTRNTLYRVIGTSQRSATDYISTITGDPQTSIIGGDIVANINASSTWFEDKSSSLFGQASYDYDNRYLFAASLRYDGFSNFAPGNRYAFFPSFSVGWNISNEEFWNVGFIDHMKIRSSYGEAGLSNLSIAATYGTYGIANYATETGLLRSNLPNPNLLWETTSTFDVGIDISLFDHRVNFVFDYYDKVTRDRLASLPLPGETGFGSIAYNVGKIGNSGIEVEIDGAVIRTSKFLWNVGFSFAKNNQLVLELPESERDKNRINGGIVFCPITGDYIEVGGWAEGERPDGLWGWSAEKIYATDEEAQAPGEPVDMMSPGATLYLPRHGGDVKWLDVDGNGIIDGRDLVFMGWRTPDKIGGMQNTFVLGNFTVRFVMDYAMGHVIMDGNLARAMGQGRSYNEGAPRMALSDKTWQEQGDTGKKYPRFSFGDYDIGRRNHLRFVHALAGYSWVGTQNSYGVDSDIYKSKGDWLAFREFSITYQVPTNVVQRLMFERISINAGVHNIGYLTAFTGLNPEVYKGFDEGGYPRPRQFTFGATFNFR